MELPDGRIAFAVGDVAGKGLQAASEMAQLRHAFQAYALEELSPAEMLARLDRLALLGGGRYSTALCGRLHPTSRRLELASAGHLPPLFVREGREPSYLDAALSLPLGIDVQVDRGEAHVCLEKGSVVVLYSDGLIERRQRSIDEGLERLEKAATGASHDLERLLDELIARMLPGGSQEDDVALLGLRLTDEA